jgi:predicted TIM-barrel fold metal-dependent hydrolase
MRRYPNLYGDLSAGSGFNALSRDEEFGLAVMEEFQDRLFFGTDFCAPSNVMPLSSWLDNLCEKGRLSRTVYEKISRANAVKLLELY